MLKTNGGYMLKKLTLFSIAVLGLVLIPTTASAHSWNSNKQTRAERQQTKRCNFFDWRQGALFRHYNQNNRILNQRIQFWINQENRRDCKPTTNTVDTLVKNGNFKTLTAAVGAAGLADTLKTQNLTVFAPTDQAFAKLPAGTVEALLNDIPTLQGILTYHAVSGTVPASTAKTLTSAPTVNGQPINISVKNGSLFINDSRVVLYDIKTTNGIIHVIDTVLLP
jgi:uncharacterized surface protein with fasciclin (FAS1) repeats